MAIYNQKTGRSIAFVKIAVNFFCIVGFLTGSFWAVKGYIYILLIDAQASAENRQEQADDIDFGMLLILYCFSVALLSEIVWRLLKRLAWIKPKKDRA